MDHVEHMRKLDRNVRIANALLWALGILSVGSVIWVFVLTSSPPYQCDEAERQVERYEQCIDSESCVLDYRRWSAYKNAQHRVEKYCE